MEEGGNLSFRVYGRSLPQIYFHKVPHPGQTSVTPSTTSSFDLPISVIGHSIGSVAVSAAARVEGLPDRAWLLQYGSRFVFHLNILNHPSVQYWGSYDCV